MSGQVIYAKASVERKPEYRQQTLIIREGESLLARKIPVGKEAAAHIRQYAENGAAIRAALLPQAPVSAVPCRLNPDGSVDFPYLEDPTLRDLLAGTTAEEYIRLLAAFREAMEASFGTAVFERTDAFTEVYGVVLLPEGLKALKLTNADLNFDNVFCPKDGQYTLIDYEWILPFPVPFSYLLYRALLLDPAYTAFSEAEQEEILRSLDINEGLKDVFFQMELSFLQWVSPEEFRLDYFARIPEAKHNVVYRLDELVVLPEENKNLSAQINRMTDEANLYIRRPWFRILRKTDDGLRRVRNRIRKFARQENAAGRACSFVLYTFREGPVSAWEKVVVPRMDKKEGQKLIRLMDRADGLKSGTKQGGEPETVKISVLVPLYNTPVPFLEEMIGSVENQTYRNWELCLADGSDEAHTEVGETCRKKAAADPRIRYEKLRENRGISENTNACIDMAEGEYLALFDHDDLLHPTALAEVARAIREEGADFVYSDEFVFESPDRTKITVTHFKPDFAPESLRSNNYICHLSVFRKSLLEKAGRFRGEYDGSQDYDLILRLTDCAEKVVHIPKVLYFWRSHPASTASNIGAKSYAAAAGRKALKDFLLTRKGIHAAVESTPEYPTMYRVRYPLRKACRACILVDLAGQAEEQVRSVLEGICGNTGYIDYTVYAVTDTEIKEELLSGRAVRLLRSRSPHRAERMNLAAAETDGDYLVFLDRELVPVNRDWLGEMLMLAQQEEIGAVGGKSTFTDGSLRHCGLITGFGNRRIAGRSHFRAQEGSKGYFGQLAVVGNVSAVSAECLAVSREKFDECGGFDSAYADTLYDADLCLKLRRAGYRNLFTPYAVFRGGESKRYTMDYGAGSGTYRADAGVFRKRWQDVLAGTDPYYNPNLTLTGNNFTIGRQALKR